MRGEALVVARLARARAALKKRVRVEVRAGAGRPGTSVGHSSEPDHDPGRRDRGRRDDPLQVARQVSCGCGGASGASVICQPAAGPLYG